VLAAWGDGHRIRYGAERPVVQDNFGDYAGRKNYALAGAYYRTSDEERAYEIARELGVRYVVATRRGSGQGAAPIGSMTWRLSLLLGSASPAGDVPALGRHRLVYLAGEPRSRVALFEVVPGARVTGSAPPGQELSFELLLRTEAGAPRLYRATARASSDGRYVLRLPYSTETPVHSSVAGVGKYQVRCADLAAELALSEGDVQEGRAAAGPSC
jgi:dolichyl-diphosphooligosaccharide--protein glycosyltransferase